MSELAQTATDARNCLTPIVDRPKPEASLLWYLAAMDNLDSGVHVPLPTDQASSLRLHGGVAVI